MNQDLSERLFRFATNVLKMLMALGRGREIGVLRFQLSKSATSAGANYEESQGASSRADFSSKIKISLREIRESNYWLRILQELFPENEAVKVLTVESQELKLILGKIASKVAGEPRQK